MSVERIVGVDFGTSTSVIRVKRYENGRAIGDRLETKSVTFNMGAGMVPTLIRKLETGESKYFGYDAETAKKKTILHQNFKPDIEHFDPEVQSKARELTRDYFGYLAKEYTNQSQGGFLGENTDNTRTLISYPVKWSEETREFILNAARDAGFPNVEGMDEAQAAIQSVTVQNANYLVKRGYFKEGKAGNILLLDMGAGTTDLVLCRHTPGEQPKTEILCTWPKQGEVLFGGREMDELLREYIVSQVPDESRELILSRLTSEQYKSWKENVVSPVLKDNGSVDMFDALDTIAGILGIDVEFQLDRAALETIAKDCLKALPELVRDCIHEGGLQSEDIDLVILTGGHSQWYFVPELVKLVLPRMATEPERIIQITRPQETVALGLVYSNLTVQLDVNMTYVGKKEATCIKSGHRGYWKNTVDGSCYEDKSRTWRLSASELPIKPLGREFVCEDLDGYRVEVCSRCGHEIQRIAKEIIPVRPSEPQKPKQTPYNPESDFDLGQIGEDYYIRKYIGNRKADVISIPPEIRGRKVVAIGDRAFMCVPNPLYRLLVKKIIIPSTVKEIGNLAFMGCRLEYVDFGLNAPVRGVVCFPKDLKRIGAHAFTYNDNIHMHPFSSVKEVKLSRHTEIIKQKKGLFGKEPMFLTSKGPTFLSSVVIFYYEDEE